MAGSVRATTANKLKTFQLKNPAAQAVGLFVFQSTERRDQATLQINR
jgi:hypothetical protein